MRNLLLIFLLVFLPLTALAAIVPDCSGPGGRCTYNDLIQLLKNVMNYLLVTIAVPAATIGIVVGGGMILLAGGDEGKIKIGKQIVWAAVWGLVIVLGAWAIVNTIMVTLDIKPIYRPPPI